MSVLNSNPFLIASGSPNDPAFPLQRSVRLRSSASAYFNRTLTTPTNNLKWTWSGWVKRGTLGTNNAVFYGGDGSSNNFAGLLFTSSDTFQFAQINGGTYNVQMATSAVFRDPSAWYHIVVVYDSANATSTDRVQIYVNGVRQTVSYTTGPFTSSTASKINSAIAHYTGKLDYSTVYFDGYLTEVNFIDGQALKPIAFGGYNPGTGVWEPRKYSGTYGTNGFYLPFTNPASIGADGSPNGNNWTANNIQTSNSALVTYDSMLDVPTNTGSNNANFATLNPIYVIPSNTANTFTNGNLTFAPTQAEGTGTSTAVSSMPLPSTGKWYWEITPTSVATIAANRTQIGIMARDKISFVPVQNTNCFGYTAFGSTQSIATGNVYSSYGASYTANDVIGVAVDLDNGAIYFAKNGTWQNSGDPTSGPTKTGAAFTTLTGASEYFPAVGYWGTFNVNFGQRPFAYTPPSGFKSLNTYNLPEPTIPRGDKYFKQYLYTGNGGGQQIGEIQKPASLFNLDRSIRIRAAQNAYFSRLPTVNGNGQKFTISAWIKRGKIGTGWTDTIFTGRTGTNFPELDIMFSTDLIKLQAYTTGAALLMNVDTVNLYRDTSMWYHVVAAFDTTQTTPADRVKVYVNGVAQTIAAGATYPSQNLVLNANQTVTQYIGSSPANTAWGDLYFADYYMIDGQQLTPTSFGAFDGNNYWTPIAYTGTYGTNGFHLEFEDYSAASASAIGKDTSGNGNNFTPTGINLTGPEVDNEYWDSYTDVPTLKDVDTCNYCTLDPLQPSSTGLRNGNLTAVWTAANTAYKQRGTYTLNTGKWYFEGNLEAFTIGNAGNTNYAIGFITTSGVDTHVSFGWTTTGTSMKLGYRYDVAGVVVQNVTYNTVTPVSTDIFGIEYDVDNGTANFYKNGTLMGSASGLALGTVNPHIWRTGSSNSATMHVNFGQRAFKYGPSTGYKKINAANVAEVTGDVETPDFVWIKSRSAATGHALFSKVTGEGKYLSSNSTAAEVTDVNSLIQFNKNGFLLGNSAIVNTLSNTYVASAWKAGNTTVTNTDGTITSQVRANQIAGFSEITYTGNGNSSATVGHGLSVTPSMIICKDRSAVAGWSIYHKSLSANTGLAFATNAAFTAASTTSGIISTSPTSTTFGFTSGSSNANNVNANGNNYVAYCFSEIAGYSKFGSYTGNGSTDGPFVYTGMRPRWLLLKLSSNVDAWLVIDSSRQTYNVMGPYLIPNTTGAEATASFIDFTANGFKIRGTGSSYNTSGGTIIYAAFAENPFKYSLAR